MNDFTWGAVPKAQDDPQLITEAITAAIAAHNNDPDAHLGDGQSLQSHRASEIIDHLVGSVVTDKLTYKESQQIFPFESIDGWGVSAGISVRAGNGVYFDAGNYPSFEYLNTTVSFPDGVGYGRTGKDWLMQWAAYIPNDNPLRATMGNCDYNAGAFRGVGFYYDGTHTKAIIKVGSINYVSGNITNDIKKLHVYRVQYTAGTNTVDFSIDGLVVFSQDLGAFSGFLWEDINFQLYPTSSNEPEMYLNQLMISRQI